MKETILKRLKKFEQDNKVEILLAVESGSRGWGFASEDSDYDVRFVYKHPNQRYLELRGPTMSHDWIEGECDYEGFDVHKFYDLLLKSNMNIIDWLFQDVIYIDRLPEKAALKRIVSIYFDRKTYIAHNYGLAMKNYHKYFMGNQVEAEPTVKRYVYCIRALLSAQYCWYNNALAPLKFDDLLEATLHGTPQLAEMRAMVEEKKHTKEKARYDNQWWRHKFISKYLQIGPLEMPEQEEQKCELPAHEVYYNLLNSHMVEWVLNGKAYLLHGD